MKYILLSTLLFLSFTSCDDAFKNEQTSEQPVWIQQASAPQQCITPTFTSLENATSQLKENDIEVIASNEQNFVVCEACSCPTGIVYQALINPNDLSKAEGLGWTTLDEGDDTP
jgi:hypothetical protein